MKNQNEPRNISARDLSQWLQASSNLPTLVDVREENELMIASFKRKIVHLPLSKINFWQSDIQSILPIERPVVVICHAGIRSFSFGLWLVEQGYGHDVWNLEGGIDSWSIQIDPSIARY